MENIYTRTVALIGDAALEKLKNAHVAVVGIGGVGCYIVEALARAGVGAVTLVDFDRVSPSNLNRQLCALNSTVGRYKVEVMQERLLDINPKIKAVAIAQKYPCPLDFESFSYVVDAIDSVDSKVRLIMDADSARVAVISAMGAGNKTDAVFKVADIYSTSDCPLAKKLRKELRQAGVTALKVVYSPSLPRVRCSPPASISYAPAMLGLQIAEQVIKDIIAR